MSVSRTLVRLVGALHVPHNILRNDPRSHHTPLFSIRRFIPYHDRPARSQGPLSPRLRVHVIFHCLNPGSSPCCNLQESRFKRPQPRRRYLCISSHNPLTYAPHIRFQRPLLCHPNSIQVTPPTRKAHHMPDMLLLTQKTFFLLLNLTPWTYAHNSPHLVRTRIIAPVIYLRNLFVRPKQHPALQAHRILSLCFFLPP